MTRRLILRVKAKLTLATLTGCTLLGLNLATPAYAETNIASTVEGIVITEYQPVCDQVVMICGRQLAPLASEIGGSFTVKINGHFRSTYECTMSKGAPQWVSIMAEGTCEEVPIITLPSKYEDLADAVG